jgi:hypothetical protein
MRPVKNKRKIDPRYFLNETADRDNLGDDLMPLDEAVDTDVGGYLKQKGKQAYSRLGQMVGGHGPSHGGAGIEADELNMFSEDLMDLQSVVYSAAQQSPLDKVGLSKFHSAFLESIRSLAEGAGNLNYEISSHGATINFIVYRMPRGRIDASRLPIVAGLSDCRVSLFNYVYDLPRLREGQAHV